MAPRSPVACDHTDDAQVEAVFDRIRDEQGRLDLVVNVASPDFSEMVGVPFWEIPFRHITRVSRHRPAVGLRHDRARRRAMMLEQGSGVVDQHLVARRRDATCCRCRTASGKAAHRQGHARHRLRAEAPRRRGRVAVAGAGAHRGPARQHGRDRRRAPRAPRPRHQLRGDAEVQRRGRGRAGGRPRRSSSAPAARSGPRRSHASTASPRTTATSPRRWPTASSPRWATTCPTTGAASSAPCRPTSAMTGCPHFPTVTAAGARPRPAARGAPRDRARSCACSCRSASRLDAHPLRGRAGDARRRALQPRRDHRHRRRPHGGVLPDRGLDPRHGRRPGTRASGDSSAATFTARRMQALRGRAQEIVDGLLDAMEQSEQPVDFVQAVALPLPITMICELLGVPFEDRRALQRVGRHLHDVERPHRRGAARRARPAHRVPRRPDRQAARRADRRHPRRARSPRATRTLR